MLAPLQTVFHTLIQMVNQFKLVDENLVSLLFSSAFPSPLVSSSVHFPIRLLLSLLHWFQITFMPTCRILAFSTVFHCREVKFCFNLLFYDFSSHSKLKFIHLLSHTDNFRFWLVISLLFVNDVRWRPKGLPKRVAKWPKAMLGRVHPLVTSEKCHFYTVNSHMHMGQFCWFSCQLLHEN